MGVISTVRGVKTCQDQATVARGWPGVIAMHMFLSHVAIWRGLSLVVGVIRSSGARGKKPQDAVLPSADLVSWCDGARSRREDELARMRQAASK